jgi:hypothetical protein
MSQRKTEEPRGGNHETLPYSVIPKNDCSEYNAGIRNFQEHMDFLHRYMVTGMMVGATCYSMACIFGGLR